MIVEERIYRLHPGKAPAYLRAYEQDGLQVQLEILGRLVGYFHTDIGPLNHVVHLWAYDDLNDRSARRGRLAADARWQAYLPKVRDFIVEQESRILLPAPFSPGY